PSGLRNLAILGSLRHRANLPLARTLWRMALQGIVNSVRGRSGILDSRFGAIVQLDRKRGPRHRRVLATNGPVGPEPRNRQVDLGARPGNVATVVSVG